MRSMTCRASGPKGGRGLAPWEQLFLYQSLDLIVAAGPLSVVPSLVQNRRGEHGRISGKKAFLAFGDSVDGVLDHLARLFVRPGLKAA